MVAEVCSRAVLFLIWAAAPAPAFLASREYGGVGVLFQASVLIFLVVLAGASGFVAVACFSARGRKRWAAVPGLTAAGLAVTGPFLIPWTLHDLAGRPVTARVMEAEALFDSATGKDTGGTRYRLADAATERDLGWTKHGPRTRTPAGAVITFSVISGGWAAPMAAERLDDTDVEPGVTAFAALGIVHVLACAVAVALWPREP
jgi:hypothetical protein